MPARANIPNLNRTEHPEESFASYEEADAYAEALEGYCSGLHKIGTKNRMDSPSQTRVDARAEKVLNL